ncbi:MAG: cation:proton antiporter [Acidiferrobacter sp.]
MVSASQGLVAQSPERVLYFILLQLVVIIGAARALGWAARQIGQPRSVGEIVAGLCLGPSLLGHMAPAVSSYVFGSASHLPLVIMSQIGLTLLMFQIGMGFDFSHVKESVNQKAVVLIAVGAVLPPFLAGVALGFGTQPFLAPHIPVLPYSLFVGTALAITAVPILGRILMEYGLTRTRVGAVVISAAAINDVVGWLMLLVVASLARAQFSAAGMGLRLVGLAIYLLVCFVVIKPVVRYAIRRIAWPATGGLPPDVLAVALLMVFVSGMATYRIGIFTIFGGFVMGIVVNEHEEFVTRFRHTVGDFVMVFFLPIFFTYAGLRTDLTGLNTGNLWMWCGIVTIVATLGKGAGSYVGARMGGMNPDASGVVAILMNTRALMELIVINIGYSAGFIPKILYTMLVVMALATTVITGPVLRRLLPRLGHVIPRNVDA